MNNRGEILKSKLVYKEITRIEHELGSLKKLLAQKRVVSLQGLLKGIKITEEEIEKAKKSLFRV